MPINAKQTIKKIVLLALSTVLISGSVAFGFSILGNVCSQVITSVITYYNAMMRQELSIP